MKYKNQLRMTMNGLRRDEVTCIHQYLNELPIRGFEKTEQRKTSDRTQKDAYTKAWFDCYRSIFPQSVRKASLDVNFYNEPTYQCSILFNNVGSFNRKSEFRKAENIEKPILQMKSSTLPAILSCHSSQNSGGKNCAHATSTAEADSSPTDANKLLKDNCLVGCDSSKKAMTCQSTRELIPQDIVSFYGNQMLMTEMDMHQTFKSDLARRQKEQSENRASDLLSNSLLS